MNILHMWRFASPQHGGGGAIAMNRLHQELLRQGIDSNILCESAADPANRIHHFRNGGRLDNLIARITIRLGLKDINRISSFAINKLPAFEQADIVHIHGTHGFINYLALPRLAKHKPLVYTLHDMWPYTGHCAVSFGCQRWASGCGQCPNLKAPPAVKRDATRIEWRLKKWVYQRANITFVSPSTRLQEEGSRGLLKNSAVKLIPHGLDLNIFQPKDKMICRSVLGLPADKQILMFAAVNLSQYHKGGDLLVKAINNLPEATKKNLLLVTIGNPSSEIQAITGIDTVGFGYIHDERIKTIVYSCADVFVSPTRGEAFGLVALESIACGTPVVANAVGGIPDIVRPEVTGFLAQPEDHQDLAAQLMRLLGDQRLLERISAQCAGVAKEEYSLALQAERHIELYRSILQHRSQ